MGGIPEGMVSGGGRLWPFGASVRGEGPNHPMLRWLTTVVVNDEEKAPSGVR